METKEWDLREEDIQIPVTLLPPQEPRYAIVVEILSVEQPWAPEKALETWMKNPDVLGVEKIPNEVEVIEKKEATSRASGGEKTSSAKALPKDKPAPVGGKNASKKALGDPNDSGLVVLTKDGDTNIPQGPQPLSKASFSFQFPGAPKPPPEIGPEIGEAMPPEIPPPPEVPPPEAPEGETDLDEPEDPPLEFIPSPPITTRFVNIQPKEFDVESNYSLWHNLLQERLLVIMYWTSPSGAMRLPFAQAHIDLFPVLALKEGKLEVSCKLERIPMPPQVEEEKPTKGKKGGKGANEKSLKKEVKSGDEKEKKKKGKKGAEKDAPQEEVLPTLLEEAQLKVAISTTNPYWSEEDILKGVVVEISFGTVLELPTKVAEHALNPPPIKDKKDSKDITESSSDPFSYTLALELPGFFGLEWWDDIKYLNPEQKALVSQIRLEGGNVEMREEAPLPADKKASIIPPEGSMEEIFRSFRKKDEAKAIEDAKTWESNLANAAKERLEQSENEELKRKLLHSESIFIPRPPTPDYDVDTQTLVKWPDCPIVKRFLPARAVAELKDLIKTGTMFRGELARIVKPQSYFHDTRFDKYHGCFFLNCSPMLEEGCYSFDQKSLFVSYSLYGTRAGVPLIDLPKPPPTPIAKKGTPQSPPKSPKGKKPPKAMPIVEQNDDPPLPICIDPAHPLPNNAWEVSKSWIPIKMQTSRPMEPPWKPPPEPEMTIETVIPPRPKQPSILDEVQMAMDKLAKFVEVVGTDLISMHQDLMAKELYEENIGDLKDPNVPPHRRFETKGEIRKKLVRQLQKQGLWHDIREEMKTKVLRVAAEKFREKKRNATDIGKFEFCNNLYVSLSELIFTTLKQMIEKTKNKKPSILDNLATLRQHADEYEAEKDYKSAARCQQERLLGDNIHNPDIWFEYGCFCMRVRPKNQGRAEECWREALTLRKNHLFSLQALGCLMWHRGFLTQAEVLFRTAINLHTEDEHISWVLVSQVYVAQGKKDTARSCLKRAEVLFMERRDAQNHYSPPHQLLSPLWKFPFSLSHQVLSWHDPTNLFVDSALMLADLHLPKEAELLMSLEADIYTCTLDYKWCRARVAELNGKLERAQNFIKEAIKIDKENPTNWLLLGHMRYSYEPPTNFTDALLNNVYRNAIDAFTQYRRYVGEENQYKFVYLELGYSFFKLGAWDDARKIFLKGCTVLPSSPAMWLAVGIAYYFVGNLNNAELALVEGNVLDTSNFKIWAYLTLTCLREERHEEAEVSFQHSLQCCVDPDLLVTIAESFGKIGNFRDAESAYLESLKARESSTVRFQLAEMYFKEGKFPFAKPNYQMIVKAKDVTLEDKSVSISRLTEMQEDEVPNKPINRHIKIALDET